MANIHAFLDTDQWQRGERHLRLGALSTGQRRVVVTTVMTVVVDTAVVDTAVVEVGGQSPESVATVLEGAAKPHRKNPLGTTSDFF